jgi:hypothetical protein
MALYFRVSDGRECTADEALDARGVLRHGYGQRVPTHLRDSRFSDGARSFWDANRDSLLVVDSRRIGGTEGSKPGFRIFDNDLGRQAKLDAYQQYEAELTSAYRNPPRLVDAAKPPPDPEEDEDEHETDPASDRRMVDASELQSHRERTLRPVYDAYALELSQAWRKR